MMKQIFSSLFSPSFSSAKEITGYGFLLPYINCSIKRINVLLSGALYAHDFGYSGTHSYLGAEHNFNFELICIN
jgi:hypothetical protein